MGYVKAQDVLPEEIIRLIQDYVDGECLYIPRKSVNKKSWGEASGARSMLNKRNIEICTEFLKGSSIKELTQKYYLSEKSVQRIIYTIK
ncbi:CD3324 family protein [Vallitalea okinawensis]|uniref:CD3324 family protein n=1 Tax=Vallitalea okinawensis TaxID=2078660 RepID=UPI000CFABDE4|nr:CD3324 family protein [Vallitalea okinawensis]